MHKRATKGMTKPRIEKEYRKKKPSKQQGFDKTENSQPNRTSEKFLQLLKIRFWT